MHRFMPLNWIQWLTLGLLLAVTVSTTMLFLRVESVQQHQNDGLRAVICRVESFELRNPKIPALQKHQDVEFWAGALSDLHAKPCLS